MSPAVLARTLFVILSSCLAVSVAPAQLSITYGTTGLQQLSYSGTVLEDTAQYGADAFHIWHMKTTDLQGNLLTGPADGWGENSTSKTWDPAARAWTYLFGWGSITCQFVQVGDVLNLVVTEVNQSNSGVVLDGAALYPLALHFPTLPSGFVDASYPQVAFNTTGPSALLANYGTAEVASIVADASKPLYSGFWPLGSGSPAYTVLISSTTPDGLATFQPHNDRPVQPGQTDTFTVSLRFAPPTTRLQALAVDAYANWSKTWPSQLTWSDKRIIGTSYLASSPSGGDVTQPGGYPNNPRRYFNSSDPNYFDVRDVIGLGKFQALVLQRAHDVVTNLTRLNAQGVITWDVEGEEYPQSTSYVCSPDQIAVESPEMESVITDSNTGYAGQKLDDAYFNIITGAGFRVGVCIRPQQFTKTPDGRAQQVYLAVTAVEAEMRGKIQYAHDRWGATLFYIDSTVTPDGAVLDAAIFQRLAASFPDSLLIPEETTPKHYAYTAAYKTFLFHGDLGTDPQVYGYYPTAFSCNLINDVDPGLLEAAVPSLVASVAAGDILMAHADYWDQNNPAIVAIYQAAGATASSPPAPVTPTTPTVPVTPTTPTDPTTPTTPTDPTTPTTPTAPSTLTVPTTPVSTSQVMIQSPAASATVSGTIQVAASIATTVDAAGTYLMVDGAEIGTARVTTAPFSYTLDTTTLSAGTHMLQVWAHTTANTVALSDVVSVLVANSTSTATAPLSTPPTTTPVTPTPSNPLPVGPVAITFPASGQAFTGVIAVAASITPQLDAAGSYLMVDGQPYGFQRVTSLPYLYQLDSTTLQPGTHTLQIWAHTTSNDTLISAPVSVSVTP